MHTPKLMQHYFAQQSFHPAFIVPPAPHGHEGTVALHVLFHMFEFKSDPARVGIILIPVLIRAT